MKRMLLVLGVLVMIAAGAAQAQTRLSVSFGFGAPRPRPYLVFRRPAFVVVGPLFVERVAVRRHRFYHRPYHRFGACSRYRCGY